MKYIQGQNREQTYLFPLSLQDMIEPDNEVRVIDCFVDSLELSKMDFKVEHGENGRPAYYPADLLKLFIYGYLNRIRSSRRLEKECKRNIEVMWLLKTLQPDHNTIANFRRDNSKAIKKVFRETVRMAKHFNLIGATLIAGDSTKFRAQNSKKNNFNQKKIDRHLEYIEKKLNQYYQDLAENDKDQQKQIKKEIEKQQERKEKYQQLEQELRETNEAQVSTSDPESRQMIIRNNITEVAYNTQTTVDGKHNILIDYNVTNNNDSKAMGPMLRRAKSILQTSSFTALYDKGYHTGSELYVADHLGIDTLVAIPANPRSSEAPDPNYNVEHFKFDNEKDCYTCPQSHELHSNGTWYKAANYRFRQFKTKACKHCLVKEKCTASKRNGKIVQRSEYADSLESNKQRVEENRELYRKRQAIVEHPYGTIKRQWGFSYILTKKTKERASADVGFMMIAYNLRRILNIIGIKAFREFLVAIFAALNRFFGFFRRFAAPLRFCWRNHRIEQFFLLPLPNKPKKCKTVTYSGGF